MSPSLHSLIHFNEIPEGWYRWMAFHYTVPLQDPKANLLVSLNVSSGPLFSSCILFYFLYLIPPDLQPSISRLCPFLSDLFIPRISSLPPPHSPIYFSSSVTTHRFCPIPSLPVLLSLSIFPSSLHSLRLLTAREFFSFFFSPRR